MRVLVTGGSGYLGTYVRQFFSADDFSRRSNLDILDQNDVQRVEEYDAIIHLAAHFDKHPSGARQCFQTTGDGMDRLVRTAGRDF